MYLFEKINLCSNRKIAVDKYYLNLNPFAQLEKAKPLSF